MVLSIFILVEMATSTAVDIYINLQDRTLCTAIEMSIQAIVCVDGYIGGYVDGYVY